MKMKMKMKIACLMLTTALLFCSCGNTANDSEEENITDEENREKIVLAYIGGSSEVTEMVNDFNNQSEEYYIEEKQYFSTDDPLYTANEKLMMDITRGEQIDIIYINLYIDTSAYIGKDMFADLYELIDSDSEISRGTFVDGVLEAYEINGKLYEIPTGFAFNTAIGRADVWEGENLSIESVSSKCAEYNARPFANLSGSDGFLTFIRGSVNEYIDFENGVCNFSDGRFQDVMEFFGGYESLSPEQAIDSFSNNESLLYYAYISSLSDMDKYKSIFGNDIIFLGMPSDNINYHTMESNCSFGILSDSDNKRGAFEFIKFYTSYDYQINYFDNFPINAEVLSLLYESEMEGSEEGVIHSSVPGNNISYEYKSSEESMNAVISEISSAYSSGGGYGETIGTIISEESETYFNGSKTAEEVCEIIQDRISIYLSEQYKK